MEGSKRGAARAAKLVAGCLMLAAASGCGSGDSSAVGANAVTTANPGRTFAPLVEMAADEPWRPMSARWFLERATLGFAEDGACADRRIAVGHTLHEQRTAIIDWIFPKGLGSTRASYFRNPFDEKCELNLDVRVHTDQLTRPHDPGPRAKGLQPGEGFYMDLTDATRGGPALGRDPTAPVYMERVNEDDDRARLSYWTLYGMHGQRGDPRSHEGDWERVDVLLKRDGDRYQPLEVRLGGTNGTSTAWDSIRRVGGTHPLVRLERATHAPTAVTRGERCDGCRKWAAWRALAPLRDEIWHGFGGAWGEVGSTSTTTGPLGPR